MQSVSLIPHPATPCSFIRQIKVRLRLRPGGRLFLDYGIEGDVDALRIPEILPPRRAEGLWRHTCCEAFLREACCPDYREFNFAPSTEWAAYRFDGYRTGMSNLETARLPDIAVHRQTGRLEIKASVELGSDSNSRDYRLALAAVLEGADGSLSYWALQHPEGKPDFHHPYGFALSLASIGDS